MDLQTRKLDFIREILNINSEKLFAKLELVLKEEQKLDPALKEKLTARALKANKNIKNGEVFNREEAENRLRKRLGI